MRITVLVPRGWSTDHSYIKALVTLQAAELIPGIQIDWNKIEIGFEEATPNPLPHVEGFSCCAPLSVVQEDAFAAIARMVEVSKTKKTNEKPWWQKQTSKRAQIYGSNTTFRKPRH